MLNRNTTSIIEYMVCICIPKKIWYV